VNIKIVKGSIVYANVDCIVNAANSQLLSGGGVCGAIFNAAGYKELQAECNSIGGCNTGDAVITKGYNLKAKYIIHAVGPIYRDSGSGVWLGRAYYNSLKLSEKNGITSIAFPAISTGIYGFPLQDACDVAIRAIKKYFIDNTNSCIIDILLYAFDDATYIALDNSIKNSN